ncbi:gastrula zinc finger protein XlCGF7.1-like [Nothobranchius furzeri]|uniref:gastrula zinc finger protein XlCGF7.1-like n=1 Tax=Nothobranchius furzeri TaxID=105023 RepID=UPI003904DA23
MAAETGGGAGTSRNPDLNPHEQTSDSSETEVSGDEDDDDVNLDSELSDSGSETGDEDDDWNESRSSESDDSRNRGEMDEKPLLLHFHNHQMKDGGVPTSSLAGLMTAKVGGGAETSKNLDLDPNENTSDSSEIEVGGEDEDDLNLDSERSYSGPETGNRDHGCNENKSSESDIKTVNKSFSCPVCGIQFLHKWSLQKHVRVTSHSAVKSSECSVTTKCVKEKQHGGSCRKVQKQPKSFSCDACGKRFSQKPSLTHHMKGHTGQKPIACDLCGQRFGHKKV